MKKQIRLVVVVVATVLAAPGWAVSIKYVFDGSITSAGGSYAPLFGETVAGSFVYDSDWDLFGMANPNRATYFATSDAYGIVVPAGVENFNSRFSASSGDHRIDIQNNQPLGSTRIVFDEFSYSTGAPVPGALRFLIALNEFVSSPAVPTALGSLELDQSLVLDNFNHRIRVVFEDGTSNIFRFQLEGLIEIPDPGTLGLLDTGLVGSLCCGVSASWNQADV